MGLSGASDAPATPRIVAGLKRLGAQLEDEVSFRQNRKFKVRRLDRVAALPAALAGPPDVPLGLASFQ